MTEVVQVRTADGSMPTHVFGDRSARTVIVYQDGVGVREVLFEIARRIAANGYFVLLPNLFYRAGDYKPFNGATVFKDPAERERVMALIKSVTTQRAMDDTRALIDHFKPRALGVVGYCMGGGKAIAAAGAFPDVVQVACSYHGGHMAIDGPDSPHLLAAKARGRIYIAYAENDGSFPGAQREKLDKALTDGGVKHAMELYHAAHGWAMRDLPAYDAKADARHWETLLAALEE